MAFKLTYTDGQESSYDDDTAWEVDDGVLKLGRTEGEWSVLLSPSHWAVIEVGKSASSDDASSKDDDEDDDDEANDDEDSKDSKDSKDSTDSTDSKDDD